MTTEDRTGRIHDLDVTLWVGKHGLDPAVDELAAELADRVDADLVETRGHTAVIAR